MSLFKYELREGVTSKMLHRPVPLDMKKYKELWKPNDYWRLMSTSYNLNIHIDYVYDLVVRFMRNVLNKFPDGAIGPMPNIFIADMAGWPLKDILWVKRLVKAVGEHGIWGLPTDGFVKLDSANAAMRKYIEEHLPKDNTYLTYEPTGALLLEPQKILNNEKLCAYVRDVEQWKYYIENSDPDIGQGQWGEVAINSGLNPLIPGMDMEEEAKEVLYLNYYKKYKDDPLCWPPDTDINDHVSDDLKAILNEGIGDEPWIKVLKAYKISQL